MVQRLLNERGDDPKGRNRWSLNGWKKYTANEEDWNPWRSGGRKKSIKGEHRDQWTFGGYKDTNDKEEDQWRFKGHMDTACEDRGNGDSVDENGAPRMKREINGDLVDARATAKMLIRINGHSMGNGETLKVNV